MFHLGNLARIFLTISLLMFLANIKLSAQPDYNSYTVSLLTYSPGEELYSSFGHSSLRVNNTAEDTDWVFNYGTFDFDDPKFYLGFVKGNLYYRLSRLPFSYVIDELNATKRSLVETPLRLSIDEKTRLIQFLELNYLPENREYLYNFLHDNCATKLIELIDFATQNRTVYNPEITPELTFRELIDPYFQSRPWLDIGIDLAMGLPVDRKVMGTESGFLPDELHLTLKNARTAGINGSSIILTGTDRLVVQHVRENRNPVIQPSWVLWPVVLLCLISTIFGSYFAVLFKYLYTAVIWTSAFLGLIIISLWLLTNHSIFGYNPDILWANPLLLVLLFLRRKPSSVSKLKLRSVLLVILATMASIGTILAFIIERNINLAALACILLLGLIEKLKATKQNIPSPLFIRE